MIHLLVPVELGDELVASGAARSRLSRPRGTLVELLVVGATAAATCVSLLQGPETVARVARAFKELARKRSPEKTVVRIKGRRGEIHLLECDKDTPLEEIARLVKNGLLD